MPHTLECRLCGAVAHAQFKKTLLQRIEVDYFLCSNCELLQTESPYWLDDAYSLDLDGLDIGEQARNVKSVGFILGVLYLFGARKSRRCVDYGGGKGTVTRLMRERGFPFFTCDRFREGVHAVPYRVESAHDAEVVTSFEVFEHFADVKHDIDDVFKGKPSIAIISTLLHWGPEKEWWYYSEESGRHIAFYSVKTMHWIAEAQGYVAIPAHAFTVFIRKDRAPHPLVRKILSKLVFRSDLMSRIGYTIDNAWPKEFWQKLKAGIRVPTEA